ncbi:uncharacterized protein PHACADRAFT_249487 [Phanerochaete carnosa HHB-10118-sp]|uniref:VTT domain-containing protein n=1 Tax=Phanerochaete carnosa (strain HHB-10118-sp) TaxID=650164 RepID=K5V8P8_PHACS|nr:uncharacterized protein PHACADRAFT_249487 [Phanerochaete carnosa HHB-10118-sp]EKM59201.1 hypothetical protein PHACADRAFT_249487 [Phanerochaete carnosa HHB-10118-sp]
MASLAPPPHPLNRHRASSTNVRPPLTLGSLGRRRSNSDLPPLCHTPSPVGTPTMQKDVSPLELDIPSSTHKLLAKATFVELYSRFMELFHTAQKESPYSSEPSSPRLSRSSTSTEDSILPISSPTAASFREAYSEKPTAIKPASSWWHGTPSVHTPVFFVIAMFPLSTALLLFFMSTLPITTAWPRNLTDLAQLGRELHGYSQSGAGPMAHVIGVLSVIVTWNHAWSIPGSVLWNVLAGALFSPALATVLLTLLTTIGSIFASLLAAPLAPYVVRYFPRALDLTRNAIEGASTDSSKSSPWIRLSILRLIGVVPWSGINIACGVCGVPMLDCFLGSFIGSLPWTAVTCQIGDILQTVASTPSPTPQSIQSLLTSPEIIFKLVFLSFLSLAPILGRKHLQALVSHSTSSADELEMSMAPGEERVARWAWIKDWRERIRVPSRSRARDSSRQELRVLIQEKNASLPL